MLNLHKSKTNYNKYTHFFNLIDVAYYFINTYSPTLGIILIYRKGKPNYIFTLTYNYSLYFDVFSDNTIHTVS